MSKRERNINSHPKAWGSRERTLGLTYEEPHAASLGLLWGPLQPLCCFWVLGKPRAGRTRLLGHSRSGKQAGRRLFPPCPRLLAAEPREVAGKGEACLAASQPGPLTIGA